MVGVFLPNTIIKNRGNFHVMCTLKCLAGGGLTKSETLTFPSTSAPPMLWFNVSHLINNFKTSWVNGHLIVLLIFINIYTRLYECGVINPLKKKKLVLSDITLHCMTSRFILDVTLRCMTSRCISTSFQSKLGKLHIHFQSDMQKNSWYILDKQPIYLTLSFKKKLHILYTFFQPIQTQSTYHPKYCVRSPTQPLT